MSPSQAARAQAVESDAEFYRMLVLDLDRTLLDRDLKVSEADIRAANALREIGVHVTIATGRLYGGTKPVADALGVHGIVATMNGSEIVDTRTGEVLVGNYIPKDTLELVRRSLHSVGVDATALFASEYIHVDDAMTPYLDHIRMWCEEIKTWDNVFSSPAWQEEERPLAVWAVGEEVVLQRVADKLREEVDTSTFEVLCFTSDHLKRAVFIFRDLREDKGTALRRLAMIQGVLPEQCVCVGDWLNDVPMLRTEALSYAMGGTPEWLHQYADRIAQTQSHADGGIIVELAREIWGLDL